MHFYKRVCPAGLLFDRLSVCPSIHPSVGPSVRPLRVFQRSAKMLVLGRLFLVAEIRIDGENPGTPFIHIHTRANTDLHEHAPTRADESNKSAEP